ncbi:DUF4269 domain-containing protein [Virgibacillus oceani]
MHHPINYFKTENEKQKRAYKVIQSLHLMNDLKEFTPILCGTIPLGIDVDSSDLDIIMEVNDFPRFEQKIRKLHSKHDNFKIKHTNIRGQKVIKANFFDRGFEFELFGQSQPVFEQHAYLHMIIEQSLLEKIPYLKEKVIKLKKRGYKTEPAFCEVLGISGDPYDNLIIYGKNNGMIK